MFKFFSTSHAVFAVVLALAPSPAHAAGRAATRRTQRKSRTSEEFGSQVGRRVRDGRLVRAKLVAQQRTQIEFEGPALRNGVLTLNLAWRGWIDAADASGVSLKSVAPVDAWQDEISLRALSASYSKGIFRVEGGLQEIAWGETFGVQVVDVVNPRDGRDPLYTELNWVRLPVAAVNAQVFLDVATLQLIGVPIPRANLFPAGVERPRPSRRPEAGGRISALLPAGLDLAALYYRHANRNAVYEARSPPFVHAVSDTVETYGVTGSFSKGALVVRQDAAYHIGQPVQAETALVVKHGTTVAQAVTGVDATVLSNWFVGGQLQYENIDHGWRTFEWLGAKTTKTFFRDQLGLELLALRGLNNADRWLQPQISFAQSNFDAALRGDFIVAGAGPKDGYLDALTGENRLTVNLGYKL